MLALVAKEIVDLVQNGFQAASKHWYVACIGHKGDLKHVAEKAAHLVRSYANLGKTNAKMMCSLCHAGAAGMPFEQVEPNPIWASSLYATRPWNSDPPLLPIPFDDSRPEMLYRLDLFHLFKVGTGRDLCGGLVLLAKFGFWDNPGDSLKLQERLTRCHKAFKLWCSVNGKTPALRYFSMSLFNMKRLTDHPWANVKGSDCMLLLQFIQWVCDIHLSSPTPESQPHGPLLKLYSRTIGHALKIFEICNSHPLWMVRICAKNLYANMMCLLSGYVSLAKATLDMNEMFFSLKPKLHGLHHVAFELQEMLKTASPVVMNPLAFGCEGNESHIGHICDLALCVDTRQIDQRVMQRCMLKFCAVARRHLESRLP